LSFYKMFHYRYVTKWLKFHSKKSNYKKKSHNNAINTDSQKHRFALLLAAGYGGVKCSIEELL